LQEGEEMTEQWPIKEGMIVAIEETLEGKPESGVFKVNPRTRRLQLPRKLQSFQVGKHSDGTVFLDRSDKEPEMYLKMNGGWRIR
jgi:hypothetical protein